RVVVASELVLVAALVVVVERGNALLGADGLVARSTIPIPAVEIVLMVGTAGACGDLVVQKLLVGRPGELRVLMPHRIPASAGELGVVETVIVDDVDHDAARAPAVSRPDRCTHEARCAKADDANRDIARRIPVERPPSRI